MSRRWSTFYAFVQYFERFEFDQVGWVWTLNWTHKLPLIHFDSLWCDNSFRFLCVFVQFANSDSISNRFPIFLAEIKTKMKLSRRSIDDIHRVVDENAALEASDILEIFANDHHWQVAVRRAVREPLRMAVNQVVCRRRGPRHPRDLAQNNNGKIKKIYKCQSLSHLYLTYFISSLSYNSRRANEWSSRR